jgi:hypothetical protein
MSIDQYAFPFKHVRPLEYATMRPASFSTREEGSGKARLVVTRIPISKKTLASGRLTVEIVCAASIARNVSPKNSCDSHIQPQKRRAVVARLPHCS